MQKVCELLPVFITRIVVDFTLHHIWKRSLPLSHISDSGYTTVGCTLAILFMCQHHNGIFSLCCLKSVPLKGGFYSLEELVMWRAGRLQKHSGNQFCDSKGDRWAGLSSQCSNQFQSVVSQKWQIMSLCMFTVYQNTFASNAQATV
jgi:hypothetical protein